MKNILLLHGWGYNSYSKVAKHATPWYKKAAFIKQLEKHYIVHTPFFPGFCGEAEPKSAWDLDDYAKYIDNYIKTNKLKVDFILGNSFGGAVAVRYKTLLGSKVPIILTVPAIIRTSANSRVFIKTPKIIKPLRNVLRDLYVIHIKKTPEMKYGTKFLRKSYQKIVRHNLINELKNFNSKEVLILLGTEDTMVDSNTIYNELSKKYGHNIQKINGGHEIAETNQDEMINYIIKFTNNK